MTAAEQLRQSITETMPFTKDEFIAKVMTRIKSQGYYPFGFSDGRSTLNGYINERDFGVIKKWLQEEGFRLVRNVSYYGVVSYFVEL